MTHNMSNTRLYRIYYGMLQRCYNPRSSGYEHYGKNGILVCEEWLNDFNNFAKWSFENGYNDELSIDRINPENGYYPENCRWIPLSENSRRVRRTNKGLQHYYDSLPNVEKMESHNHNQAQQKYMRKNYVRFPLDLRPEVLEAFRAACEKNGTKPTTEIKKFIAKYIE